MAPWMIPRHFEHIGFLVKLLYGIHIHGLMVVLFVCAWCLRSPIVTCQGPPIKIVKETQ